MTPSSTDANTLVEWQPIETYPFDGTRVLVWSALEGEREDGPHPLPAYCDEEDGIWWLAQGLEEVEDPEWWTPMLAAPSRARAAESSK